MKYRSVVPVLPRIAPAFRRLPGLALLAALASALALALASPPASGADARETSPAPPGPRVLTSFLPVHSLALAVAGSRARVENWLPTGVDPHDFQFSPRDLRRLATADLLVVGGLGLEGWKESRLREASGNARLRVLEAASGIPESSLIHDPCGHDHGPGEAAAHDHEAPNPHFWLDPLLAVHAVSNIVAGLSAADPAGSPGYQARGAEVMERLQALHREFEAALAPARQTPFLTVHNAFPYLARRYQLRLAGVVQRTGNEEPSARELSDLARTARDQGIQVLFNDGPPSRLTRRLAADLKLRIAILETLETGQLGPGAYEEGMRRNLKALREALIPGR